MKIINTFKSYSNKNFLHITYLAQKLQNNFYKDCKTLLDKRTSIYGLKFFNRIIQFVMKYRCFNFSSIKSQ